MIGGHGETSHSVHHPMNIALYTYTWNNPLRFVDPTGLLVEAVYDTAAGTLTVTDKDTKKTITVDVESGGKPYGGPIPKGKWEILERGGDKPHWFRLDAVDANPRDDVHEATGRSKFRLHGPGMTVGCIACKDRNKYNDLVRLIQDTKTEVVTDRGVPWYKFWSNDKIKKFGDLVVK